MNPLGIAGYFKDPDGHLFEADYKNAWGRRSKSLYNG